MIRLTLTAIATGTALLLTAPAHAGGPVFVPDDPVVEVPRDTWSGPYVGLSYGRVTGSIETVECFKLGQPKACDDPIFAYYPEYKVEVRSQTATSDTVAGALLGYRFDLGRVVPGIEVGIYDGDAVPGVSVGVDLGRVLPYAHYSRDGAAVGVDVRLGDRLTVGARAAEGSAAVMVGVKW